MLRLLIKFLKIFSVTFLLLFPAVFPKPALGQNNFIIDSHIKYFFTNGAETKVVHEIKLENNLPTVYAKSYSVSFQNINPENINVNDKDNNPYIFATSGDNNTTTIKIEFPDDLIGKGASRLFYVSYTSRVFSKKYGEVVEVNIPKLSDPENFRTYWAEIIIPDSFGRKSYLSPNPTNEIKDGKTTVFSYDKSALSGQGVSAAFGDFQVFNFTINYHIENPLSKMGETEIALPPDTAFQRMFYENIDPMPLDIKSDGDGNWLARYILPPRKKIDITARGSVKIFSKGIPSGNTKSDLSENLLPTAFWQADDGKIKKTALELKTANKIYDYVVGTLNYNYEKVKPNSERLGALKALEDPNNSICMEFTDLFVALARAAGIPSREINGYAYADNPSIQPMSLVADVLHSWPEYWDTRQKMWIPVDPTWGKTTGGEDFFNKLDLRHFTFVIHGSSDTKPYPPGSYRLGTDPGKDIYISFGKLPQYTTPVVNIEVAGLKNIPVPGRDIIVKIINKNGYSIENEPLTIYYDSTENERQVVPVILPYSSHELSIKYPYSPLGKNSPKNIRFTYFGSEKTIEGIKTGSIIVSLLFLFVFLLLIIFIYLIVLKYLPVLKNIKARIGGRS